MKKITNERLQDILNPLNENMDAVIDAFVEFYGKQYREVITEKLKNITFVTAMKWESADFSSIQKYLTIYAHKQKLKDIIEANEIFKRFKIHFKTSSLDPENIKNEMQTVANLILHIADIKIDEHFYDNYNKLNARLSYYDKHNLTNRRMFKNSLFSDTRHLVRGESSEKLTQAVNEDEAKCAPNYALALEFKKDWLNYCETRERPIAEFLNDNNIGKKLDKLDEEELQIKNGALKRFYNTYGAKLGELEFNTIEKLYEYKEMIIDLITVFTEAKEVDEKRFNDLLFNETFLETLSVLGIPKKIWSDVEFLTELLYDKKLLFGLMDINSKSNEISFEDPIAKSALERVKNMDRDYVSYVKHMIENHDNVLGLTTCEIDLPNEVALPVVTIFNLHNETLIHEIVHCLGLHFDSNFPTRGFCTYHCGFNQFAYCYKQEKCAVKMDVTSSSNGGDNYQYTGFDEVINELIAYNICEILKNKGVTLYDDNYLSGSIYREVFPLYEEFFHKYKNLILEYLMSSNPLNLRNLVGHESFDDLAEATNKMLFKYYNNDDNSRLNLNTILKIVNKKLNLNLSSYSELNYFCDDFVVNSKESQLFSKNELEYLKCIKIINSSFKKMQFNIDKKLKEDNEDKHKIATQKSIKDAQNKDDEYDELKITGTRLIPSMTENSELQSGETLTHNSELEIFGPASNGKTNNDKNDLNC